MDVFNLRKKLGMTQAEFAAFVRTRQATVSEWETGTKKPTPMACHLLELLTEKVDREKTKKGEKK